MNASDPTNAVRELANVLLAALVNALKFTLMTPIEASHVRNSMNNAETKATSLKASAAIFFNPYPSRNPNVPPKPTWLASSVAKPFVSIGVRCMRHLSLWL